MQARVDQIRRELDEQRERDGGVFMSQEKKDEMERKVMELEVLKKEYADLVVSNMLYVPFLSCITIYHCHEYWVSLFSGVRKVTKFIITLMCMSFHAALRSHSSRMPTLYRLFPQTLFDLKSNELNETIQQLEEKSAILFKTQEEKEIQEHLVARHTDTEQKISKQAFALRETADQQFSHLQKLQDVRERKRYKKLLMV